LVNKQSAFVNMKLIESHRMYF